MQPFPGPGRRELISTNGGGQPAWAGNGRELFYREQGPGQTWRMMAVDVTAGRGVHRGSTPRAVGGDAGDGIQAERVAEPTTSRRMPGAS